MRPVARGRCATGVEARFGFRVENEDINPLFLCSYKGIDIIFPYCGCCIEHDHPFVPFGECAFVDEISSPMNGLFNRVLLGKRMDDCSMKLRDEPIFRGREGGGVGNEDDRIKPVRLGSLFCQRNRLWPRDPDFINDKHIDAGCRDWESPTAYDR